GTGAPGTFDVTKSQHFNMPPNSAVVVDVGNRLRTPASVLVICNAGSARHPLTNARIACIRSRGSSIVNGTGKRAGANRLPPDASCELRRLIGKVMRNALGSAPCRS